MLTSIVILTFNELEYTRRCVDSIAACTPEPHELILVDNGSTDGTVEFLRGIPGATVIANDANLGFGGGCNQGMAVAAGDRILLLNNDTVVTDGWMAALHRGLDGDPERGIVGPRSNHVAGCQRVADVPYDVWSLEGLDEYVHSRAIAPGAGFQTPRLIGFCMLIRREVIDTIGGFDLRFGLGNMEDDDICMRAAVAGYEHWVCDDSWVHHFGSRTFAGAGIVQSSSLEKNWQRFAQKWHVPRELIDFENKSYLPGPIAERTAFDPHAHYAPLVASPDNGARVELETAGRSLLVLADAGDPRATRETFASVLAAASGAADVTVVVRIDPSDATSLGLLEEAADDCAAALPDIVVMPASSRNDIAAIRACDSVVLFGRMASATAGTARWCGTAAIALAELPAGLDGSSTQAA